MSQLKKVVERIKSLDEAGSELRLVIGRSCAERKHPPLPDSRDGKVIWIFGNIDDPVHETVPEAKIEKGSAQEAKNEKDPIQITCDFNIMFCPPTLLKPLANTFTQIVFDLSTWKFFPNVVANLKWYCTLLKKGGKLVFDPACIGGYQIVYGNDENDPDYDGVCNSDTSDFKMFYRPTALPFHFAYHLRFVRSSDDEKRKLVMKVLCDKYTAASTILQLGYSAGKVVHDEYPIKSAHYPSPEFHLVYTK
jgi:hypothetical protein